MTAGPTLGERDPDIKRIIESEEQRQRGSIDLIASENHISRAVMEASSCVMTNKYAEGYPGRRYYSGCEHVDEAESLAIDRAKRLFGAEHANVQPHSGSQANIAAFIATIMPGDKVMGLALDHGGHLSHGSPVNISGRYYEVSSYEVNRDTEMLDYDAIQKAAEEFRPKLIIAGFSAYSRQVDFKRFGEIARAVDAFLLADISHIAGLVAGGVHPSPLEHADITTTTTHKTLRGPRGALAMAKPDLAKKYNLAVFPRLQGGPLMHAVAAKAVAFHEALQPSFREYAKQVVENARAMAAVLTDGGLRIVSGGTDTHLFAVDLRPAGLTGAEVEGALAQAGIYVNKNVIPFDEQPAQIASGIRIGTAAITTRGMGADHARHVAEMILEALKCRDDQSKLGAIRDKVRGFVGDFPVPGIG